MSYMKFSLAQSAPGKDNAGDKPKETPPAGQPTPQPDQKPAVVAPAPKS